MNSINSFPPASLPIPVPRRWEGGSSEGSADDFFVFSAPLSSSPLTSDDLQSPQEE